MQFEANTVTSEEDALTFVNEYGFVTLFPIRNTPFPNLYQAIQGTREEKFDKTWTWGYQLAQKKQLYYGKFIRKQVTLISLELFPYFLRLACDHHLGGTAQRILTYLRTHGKTSTTNLRKHLDFQKKEKKSEFTRAIDELHSAFFIAIVERGAYPRYTNTYDLMERWMPKPLLKMAKTITVEAAREKIITQLQTTGVIATQSEAKRFIRF